MRVHHFRVSREEFYLDIRVGLGHDTHRMKTGKPLVIGGIAIDHDCGPDSHSDGDVLFHALTDALLGAVAAGDVGEWFPDNDLQWKNVDSVLFLQKAKEEIERRGYAIVNIDCTVFAERPKLNPYKERIKSNLSVVLQLDKDNINIKAKTGEKVGPIGREEAIAADAVVLIQK